MNRARTSPLTAAVISLLLLAGPVLSTPAADAQPVPHSAQLADLLDRFDKVQESIRTLSADLTMTNISRLLKEPVVYRGHFYMTKPNAVRWEFDTPEEMRFVIANDQYLGYFPAQKRAERKNIRRWSEQLFRYVGLGQDSVELSKFYHMTLEEPGKEMPGTHLLVMTPKKRRAKKRVDDVRFWIDADSLMPKKVEYRSVDGNVRVVEFKRMQLNVEIASSVYAVDVPSDVSISTGFTPFGGVPGS